MIKANTLFVSSLIFGFSMGVRKEWPLLLFHRGLVQRVSHLCSLDVTRPGGGATNHHGAQVVHIVVHILVHVVVHVVVHGSGVVGRGKCHCQRTQLVTIFITIILIIITTRPKPAYGRQGLAGVSLHTVGAQLRFNKNVVDIHTLYHDRYINITNLHCVPKLDCQKRLNFENVNFEKQYHRNKCISITVLLVLHFSLLNGDNNTKEAFSRVD